MKKLTMGSLGRWAVVALCLPVSIAVSAGGRPQQSARPASTVTSTPSAAPAEYHALVTKYCVTCHNERLKTPAASPLLLDKANLDDPGADPAVWEKVVRKLNLGSMPPQGSPLPDPQSRPACARGSRPRWIGPPTPATTPGVWPCTG